MPFIDCKVTLKLTEDEKEIVKTKLWKALSILHKPESFLMVGINDGYDLYFAGKKLQKGAYVEVSLFGSATPADCERMTGEICNILGGLSVPADKIYVTYHGIKDWGWNGSNF